MKKYIAPEVEIVVFEDVMLGQLLGGVLTEPSGIEDGGNL